jgi:hypothetical protein
MKETYKEILDKILVELETNVNNDLKMFDDYIKHLLNPENKRGLLGTEIIKDQPDILDKYKNLYELNLRRNKLYEYLYKYEEGLKDDNLTLLKEINSLLYEINFNLEKKLNIMINIIYELNKKLL